MNTIEDYFDNEDYFDSPEEDESEELAEAMLKRLEKKEQAKASKNFKSSLSEKVWRTKDGRYIDIKAMDDNHLLNSYHMVERNIKGYLKINSTYTGAEIDILLNNDLSELAQTFRIALGSQVSGYKFLKEEITERNLFGRRLSEATDDAFSIFDDIINSKEEDDETQ